MKLATLCYLKRDGRTLMLHRNKRPDDYHYGKWNGLGGKLEPGESPEDCAVREVFEESGLSIKAARLRGILTFPNFDGQDDWYCFLFTATEFAGRLRHPAEGELRWVPDDELYGLNLWAADPIFLSWLDEDRFFSAKFVYDDGALLDYSVSFYP